MSYLSDDKWKDSYDAWKLASPDDEYDDPCDHENYGIDVCTGRAECETCGERWWASDDEVVAELDRQASYDEYVRREERRRWWADKTYWLRWPVFRLLQWLRFRRSHAVLTDDEIPF